MKWEKWKNDMIRFEFNFYKSDVCRYDAGKKEVTQEILRLIKTTKP